MAIQSSELKAYKSSVVTDTTANGGKMSANIITSATRNNIFPNVSQAERTAGKIRYRKVFLKVANDDDLTLNNGRAYLSGYTTGDDRVTMFEGTQTDTQNDISSPDEYGCGFLATSESAGSSVFDVTIEDSAQTIFRTGDTIWISDGSNSEFHDNVTIAKVGSTVTVTLDTGDMLANAYTAAADCIVASVIDAGNVAGSIASWIETSSAGTYNESTYPVLIDNIGSIEESWTITFTSATAFTCSGTVVGSVGTGNITTDFTPTNTNFTKPYFNLRASGWGGTWATNDTITFTTHPAAVPVWLKQTVPAGANSESNNQFTLQMSGESA